MSQLNPPAKAIVIDGHAIGKGFLVALISNCHQMLKRKYIHLPLWKLVSDITGSDSVESFELCLAAGYDPLQPCGPRYLKASATDQPRDTANG